ncbi:hypothetical protein GCM10009792_25010 [Microcella alkalica]|uniref:DUF2510 domain-containing protein n=1 Tax=Microcella alkalica TaxID=355930 RepID=A0A839E2G7_9MICO|nr:hypothetical protein [Microcella alkalica]
MTDIVIIQPREGWFADPTIPGQERWWDGAEWTSRTRPAARTAPVGPEQPASPDQIETAIESAEAYTELVGLAPPRIDDRLVTRVDAAELADAARQPSARAGYAAAIAVGMLGSALIAATAVITTGLVQSGTVALPF